MRLRSILPEDKKDTFSNDLLIWLWYLTFFQAEDGATSLASLISAAQGHLSWWLCCYFLVERASGVDWRAALKGGVFFLPLENVLSFRPNPGFPRSKRWRKRDNWVPRAERSVDFSLGEGTLTLQAAARVQRDVTKLSHQKAVLQPGIHCMQLLGEKKLFSKQT